MQPIPIRTTTDSDTSVAKYKKHNNALYFVATVVVIAVIVIVSITLSDNDDSGRYFVDKVWTSDTCADITDPPTGHPCYVIGSNICEPLDVSPYTEMQYRGITYFVQNVNDQPSNWIEEIDLLLNCTSDAIDFQSLISTYGQPVILLLENYLGSKWAHYSTGLPDCNLDRRIVMPNKHVVERHTGVLIHEFAHYFQHILRGFVQPCADDLFDIIVPHKYGDAQWGDGMRWPYCYGLSDGSPGVPNSIELMAIISEGACSLPTYDRVCGPTWEYLNSGALGANVQKECLLALYNNTI